MTLTDSMSAEGRAQCIGSGPIIASGFYRGRLLVVLGVAVALTVAIVRQPLYAHSLVSETEISLDIPAQPLGSALEAYGAATGLAVFYDADLAAGYRSNVLKGRFLPSIALEILLRGTGYVSRLTGPDAISIAPIPSGAVPSMAAAQQRLYDSYFAILQARIGQVLCGSDRADPGNESVIFRFWISPLGVIGRAEAISTGVGQKSIVAAGVQGLDVGLPPPVGLPQPVMMVVFPPSPGEVPGCVARHG